MEHEDIPQSETVRKDQIEELQKQKLRLEIEELNKKWFKRKDYWQAIFPSLLAILSVIYALSSGFLNAKYETFQLQKEKLIRDIDFFEITKSKIIQDTVKLARERDVLIVSNKGLIKKMDSLTFRVLTSEKVSKKLDKKIDSLNQVIKDLPVLFAYQDPHRGLGESLAYTSLRLETELIHALTQRALATFPNVPRNEITNQPGFRNLREFKKLLLLNNIELYDENGNPKPPNNADIEARAMVICQSVNDNLEGRFIGTE